MVRARWVPFVIDREQEMDKANGLDYEALVSPVTARLLDEYLTQEGRCYRRVSSVAVFNRNSKNNTTETFIKKIIRCRLDPNLLLLSFQTRPGSQLTRRTNRHRPSKKGTGKAQ